MGNDERKIAEAERFQDMVDEEIVSLREQVLELKGAVGVLQRHSAALETMIRHIGIELAELKSKEWKSMNS